jgi:hypothetical protein
MKFDFFFYLREAGARNTTEDEKKVLETLLGMRRRC